jgi:hypothetical protein
MDGICGSKISDIESLKSLRHIAVKRGIDPELFVKTFNNNGVIPEKEEEVIPEKKKKVYWAKRNNKNQWLLR